MRIAIIGSKGQLGSALLNVFADEDCLEIDLPAHDITDLAEICETMSGFSPNLVVHTAAMTNVDGCERNPELAYRVNVLGTRNVAVAAQQVGARLVYISTDYVFDGEKGSPYIESDCPRPLSAYGISKLGGEYAVRYIMEKYYMVRLCGLYGHAGCVGKGSTNFVEMVIKRAAEKKEIRVVSDQIVTPTSTTDVSRKLFELIEKGKYGIYHMTNTGSCSWYEFAAEIVKLAGMDAEVLPLTAEQFGARAMRPGYSVLDNLNLRRAGLDDLRNWKEALKDYIESRNN